MVRSLVMTGTYLPNVARNHETATLVANMRRNLRRAHAESILIMHARICGVLFAAIIVAAFAAPSSQIPG